MKPILSIPAAVVLLASLSCFVAAKMTRESCSKLLKDSNGIWQSVSQVLECYDLLEAPKKLYRLKDIVSNSFDHTNCNDLFKLSQLYHYTNDKELWQGEEKQPSFIKKALIARGLRLSASCRKDMVKVISSQLDGILTDEDFAPLAAWTSNNNALAKLFASDKKNKGLALPSPMVKLVKAKKRAHLPPIAVELPANTSFGLAHAVCERRFKPIYEKITDPLIELAMAGFQYEPKTSEAVDEETARKVQNWYRTVFVCKQMEGINVVEKDNLKAGELKIIGQMELMHNQILHSKPTYPDIKQLKFDYELVDGGDDGLVDVNDAELMKAISKYHEPSLGFGLMTTLKLALGQKGSMRPTDNKAAAADADDKAIDDFFAVYSKTLEAANSPSLHEIKHTIKSKGGQALRWSLANTVIGALPFLWWLWLPSYDIFTGKNHRSALNWDVYASAY